MSNTLLFIEKLCKSFGGLQALSDVNFIVNKGEIYGVIGPNGAGKSTLFNVITGLDRGNSGRIIFKGRDISSMSPHGIVGCGISRAYQLVRLWDNMTVLENVMVGRHIHSKTSLLSIVLQSRRARLEETSSREYARELLREVGLIEYAGEMPSALPGGHSKLVELARSLAAEPELVLLDEPAGGMNQAEKDVVCRIIKNFRGRGITFVIVEHDMRFIMGLVDRLVVLNFGNKIAEGTPEEVQNNPDVIRAYLGRKR